MDGQRAKGDLWAMGLWEGGLKKKITVLKRRKMQRKGFSQVCFPVHWYIVEAVVKIRLSSTCAKTSWV